MRQNKDSAFFYLAVKEKDDNISITIQDNGSGISSDKCKQILSQMAEVKQHGILEEEEGYSHIGIMNVFQRLYLEYDSKLEFNFKTKKYYGTKIEIVFPRKKDNYV